MDYLIVGLGNPGTEYNNTRHNIGFLMIDALARKYSVQINKKRFNGLCNQVEINGKKVLLLKPTTYMNNSGESVHQAAGFYKIPTDRIIIVCDDISLPTSKIRIRLRGSAGGHNGLKSIIAHLNSDEFQRIKVGISDRNDPGTDLADWVLGTFSKQERDLIDSKTDNIIHALELMISGNTQKAMDLYNGKAIE